MRAGTETRDSALRLDLELSNNGNIYAERQKNNELGFTEDTGKDNFGQSHDMSQISGREIWNFKFSQNTVQRGFTLFGPLISSTNMSGERKWIS
ncbi:MAG: hypothetical protein EZS28_032732 [Streblomastix strix]|uniref:Uncharacterized protein n=1 Tax=Streblomastix strix TaxID=222440 RepID=A0A5J4UNU6_9EUKA|nr:MAG: hypothetical protein EZS28_032732 [Streblomastix strix]